MGIFPMADSADDPDIFWVEPELRGLIPLDGYIIPKRLARTLRSGRFSVRMNSAFDEVLEGCAQTTTQRTSTWINNTIRRLYKDLHRMGHAHSVDVYEQDQLVGGLYGVSLGCAFFGESMFSRQRDASKVALATLLPHLKARGFSLCDTQFVTDHLRQFGAIEVERSEYLILLQRALTAGEATFMPATTTTL